MNDASKESEKIVRQLIFKLLDILDGQPFYRANRALEYARNALEGRSYITSQYVPTDARSLRDHVLIAAPGDEDAPRE